MTDVYAHLHENVIHGVGVFMPADHMWEVKIDQNNLKYNMKGRLAEGTYRMYLSEKHLGLVGLNKDESDFDLPVSSRHFDLVLVSSPTL